MQPLRVLKRIIAPGESTEAPRCSGLLLEDGLATTRADVPTCRNGRKSYYPGLGGLELQCVSRGIAYNAYKTF